MDPISHGLIGAGIAVISGQPVSFDNPVFLGTVLGSMAPDLDIVAHARGHVTYLKHHRGISHSIPGLLGFSALISVVLLLIFPGTAFWPLFGWTFLGTLSHSIFDLLNSYGARLLWPFVKRRLTINFIMLTDPIILAAFLLAFILRGQVYASLAAFIISGLYLLLRWKSKQKAFNLVKQRIGLESVRILVLPAMYRPFSWGFVVEREEDFVTGTIPFGKREPFIRDTLSKHDHPLIEAVEDSALGEVFREFTPFYHVYFDETDCQIVRYLDLRYHAQKSGYMYTGMAVLDTEGELVEAVFKPYSSRRGFKVA